MKNENRIKILRHLSTKTLAMIRLAVVTYEQSHCKGTTEWNDLIEDLNAELTIRKNTADPVNQKLDRENGTALIVIEKE